MSSFFDNSYSKAKSAKAVFCSMDKRRAVPIFLLVFLGFLLLSAVLRNFSLVYYSFAGSRETLLQKLNLVFGLVRGLSGSMETVSFALLVVTGVLTALNIVLLVEKASALGKHATFTFGGSVVGAVVGGCAACGVPALSAIGLSSSILVALPFEGMELSVLAVVVLMYSVWLGVKSLSNDSCRV